VAFDVDSTLYRQRPLRLGMGRDMVRHSVAKCDLNATSVVSAYRRIREPAGEETAKAKSMSPERVHTIVSEWIETRPLRYLRSCLFSGSAGIVRWIGAARRSASFSDYPATEKLVAMGLAANRVVAASESCEGFRVAHGRCRFGSP